MIPFLISNQTSLCPSRETALRALRHLSRGQRRNLFSEELGTMKAAEGRWYEAMVYEMVLDLAIDSPSIRGVVGRGADARRRAVKAALGQNGMFYSRGGDIKIRGNGQDLAEIDLLMAGTDGSVAFGEIITSQANLRELEEEIEYKKNLLGYLYGQERVQFVLVSSVDISRISTIRRLLKDRDNAFISTANCEGVRGQIGPGEWWSVGRAPVKHPKVIQLEELPPSRRMDYRQEHDMERSAILHAIAEGADLRGARRNGERWTPVRKVLMGGLYSNAARMLIREKVLHVKGKRLSEEDLRRGFQGVILAINLPEYEPVLYLRLRRKREYLKMAFQRDGSFKCESSRSKKMLGFFLWLESVQPSLGVGITRRLLDSDVFSPRPGNSRKAG